MKFLNLFLSLLLGFSVFACNRTDDIGGDDELDLQREEEYQSDDIREHELDLER